MLNVVVDNESIEVVDSFCYLGDMITSGGGCSEATVVRCRTAWKKFKELLPLLTSKSISLRNRGKVFVTYVRSALLHASECWALKKEELLRLQRNERAMLRWILNFRITDRISSVELYRKLKIPTLESALRKNRLRWFGHTQRSDQWINKIQTFDVTGNAGRGRPSKTWKDVISDNIKSWTIPVDSCQDRSKWRKNMYDSMAKSNPWLHG